MRKGRLSGLLILSCVPLLAQSTSNRATIQQSLGFEDQSGPSLTGWYSALPDTVFADDKVVHSGHWSVRLQRDAKSAGNFSSISRVLPSDFKGQRIELRGYLKLQDVTDFAGLWLREDGDDGEVLSIDNMQAQQVKGTRDWAEYHIELLINPNAQTIHFGVLSGGTGTLWADDLELLVDGKPIAEAPAAAVVLGLPVDHEFDSGSGVALRELSSIQISNLVTLARVWGFLKYHHPAITAGQHNWDYDLFRIMPKVLAARDREQANDVLLKWIDTLGPVAACSPCVSAPAGELDLRPELAWTHDRQALGAPLSERLEFIYANRTGKQFFVSQEPAGNASFHHEPAYPAVKFPDSGYQLLALFRWWNIMQYWAPYRAVAGQDWNAVLAEFIPRMALAKDKDAYQLVLFELIATANDSHANLWSSLALRPPTGECALPVAIRFLNGKAVVYRKNANEGALKPGDIVDGIGGVTVSSLVEKVAPYYADSNEAARRRDLALDLSRGACGPVSVEIVRDGKTEEVSAERVHNQSLSATHDLPGDTFRLLSPEVAYVKLSSVKANDVPSYFERANDTKGLIVDIRNYPSAFMPFVMGAYLAVKPTAFANFTFLNLANPGAFRFASGPLIQPGTSHYGGKVVILVDESSQSQAEYTAMALRAMPNAVVMGSTTAGADGNVSTIPLPGGLSTWISGLGVFYPDHRPTQRVGIVPDVEIRPTVRGIAEGRDELVDAAARLIEDSGDRGETANRHAEK